MNAVVCGKGFATERFFFIGLLAITHGLSAAGSTAPPYQASLDMPPRLQWNANHGYCGEVSFVSAGLYYGQYCSQFTARDLASPGVRQSEVESQLLLGVNDRLAAENMRLVGEGFSLDGRQSARGFLTWIKNHIFQKHPVIIGVFNNISRLGGLPPGDEEYDHIVPVFAVDSSEPFDSARRRFLGDDVIHFSDNGLYTPNGRPDFCFHSTFSGFLKNRRAANESHAAAYALKNHPNHYGFAVTGVADSDSSTIPVRLRASLNHEPELADGGIVPPKPVPLDLTATVFIPDQSVAYNLYRYDSFLKVPTGSFNAKASSAAQSWVIPPRSGATFQVVHSTNTGATVVFRAVPATAP
jgi:hypothetical protein